MPTHDTLRLVVLEGLDYTGKSSLIKELSAKHPSFAVSRGSISKPDETASSLLPALDAAQRELYYNWLLIQDKLTVDKGSYLLDRYFPSVRYFGELQLGEQSISRQISPYHFIKPEVILYLTCTYACKVGRAAGRIGNDNDRYLLQSQKTHNACEAIYDAIMQDLQNKGFKVVPVDTSSRTIETITTSLEDYLR